jgi:HrpA-like RNA helicase
MYINCIYFHFKTNNLLIYQSNNKTMPYSLQVLGGSTEVALPTLLKTNVVTKGDPKDSLPTLKQYRGVDYIIKYIQSHTADVKSAGDKVFSIQSGTGSGKSTVIPPELYRKLDAKRIIVTEPKRINAINIPQEIIQFNEEFELGLNIGYSTGIIKRLPDEPGIIFMTTGSLLQRLINMKDLEAFSYRYDYILIDEVHLHDVEIDFLLMEIKHLLDHNWKNPKCPNIILMSATLKVQKYQEYFGSPHFIEVTGQSFPIKEIWPDESPEKSDAYIVNMIEKYNKPKTPNYGDVLIFMPSMSSMKKLKEYLDQSIKGYTTVLLSGSNIASAEIVPVFDRARDAKESPYIIVSTNVAETGITFPQLKLVFDMGKQLHVMFNPTFDATVIYTGAITKFSAQQRRGRVGRNSEGQWFPVYTKKAYDSMIDENFPAIYTSDITQVMLSYLCRVNDIKEVETILKHMEIEDSGSKVISIKNKLDLNELDLIHYPAVDTIKYTFEKLYVLGMVDKQFYPTVTGYIAQKLNKIPIEASKMVVSGFYHTMNTSNFSTINYIITIAAILSQQKSGIIDKDEWLESPIAKDVKWFNDTIVYDDFIIQLLAFEYFDAEFQTLKKKDDWTLLDIKTWCDENNYNFDALLQVIEQRDDIMINLLQTGFKIPSGYVPLKDLVETKSTTLLDIVQIIQQCEVEGFRFKLYKWNANAKKYQLEYSPSKLSVDPPPGIATKYVDYKDHNWATNPKIPKNIIQLNIVYLALKGQMTFTNGKTMFSVLLTDIIELDDLFIP